MLPLKARLCNNSHPRRDAIALTAIISSPPWVTPTVYGLLSDPARLASPTQHHQLLDFHYHLSTTIPCWLLAPGRIASYGVSRKGQLKGATSPFHSTSLPPFVPSLPFLPLFTLSSVPLSSPLPFISLPLKVEPAKIQLRDLGGGNCEHVTGV